jgi:UDP-N-acetyl-2-amino-2-deoxyglucuronate dehydrogenase
MLLWVFGGVRENKIVEIGEDHAQGVLQLEKANVKWFLSINNKHLPDDALNAGKRTYRSLKIEGKEIEFSDGFTDLHTQSYREILAGNGFGLEEALPSIEVVHAMRESR